MPQHELRQTRISQDWGSLKHLQNMAVSGGRVVIRGNLVPKDHQIGGWLPGQEKRALDDYLKQFAIRPTAAATLLIVRELRCKRLATLKEQYSGPIGTERKRMTAHQPDGKLKRAFTEHATSVGMDPDPAASVLFRAELDERWLERLVESA